MAVAKTSSLLAALIVLLAVLPSGVSGADAPTPAAARPSTILKVLRRDPRVTQLGDLVRTSGIDLTPLRNPETKFSVFAPNNTVFERLRQKNNVSVAQLLQGSRTPAGQKLLRTHIYTTAALNASELKDGQVLTMSSGVNVTVRKTGAVTRLVAPGSSANVTDSKGIRVGKSVVYILDGPLLPLQASKTEKRATGGGVAKKANVTAGASERKKAYAPSPRATATKEKKRAAAPAPGASEAQEKEESPT